MGLTTTILNKLFTTNFQVSCYVTYPAALAEQEWKNLNEKDFSYDDPENGVGAIRGNRASQDLDSTLCSQGFLTQYAMSGFENDLNTFAQNLFEPAPDFWKVVDKISQDKAKTILLVKFYNTLNSQFTESYFKKFNRRK